MQGHHIAAIQELLARNNVAYSEVGENLIGDTGYALDAGTPQQAVRAWMHSPEHRANILHADTRLSGWVWPPKTNPMACGW